MKKRLFVAVASIIILVCTLTPQTARAEQPYVGGYFDYSFQLLYSTSVLAYHTFDLDPTQIPVGHWLGSLTSVAGGNFTGFPPSLYPTGWVCQNVVALERDNDVLWAPQAWYEGEMEEYHVEEVGTGDYVRFYTRTGVSGDYMAYSCYAYEDEADVLNDTPELYQWSHSTSDTCVLVGTETYGGYKYKYFQFGVESSCPIADWQIIHRNPCYKSGSTWYYKNAAILSRCQSLITRIGSTRYLIGGTDYLGAYVFDSETCQVTWGCTGETLWSGTGTIDDDVEDPY